MLVHLLGAIGCSICLGLTAFSGFRQINRSLPLDSEDSTLISSIHEYRGITINYDSSVDDFCYRIYYTYDVNTREFTYDNFNKFTYPFLLDTPSSSTDYDTITSNYIKINSLIHTNGASSTLNTVAFYYIFTTNFVYRVCVYNDDTFANLGYLEYFSNSSSFSLLASGEYSGYTYSKAINYNSFYNVGNQSWHYYSYFDDQPGGDMSRILYYSYYNYVSYSDNSLLLSVDFDLYSLPDSYSGGYSSGYDIGYNNGYDTGYGTGYDEAKDYWYQQGYNQGRSDATPLEVSFLGLLGAIADTPVLIIRNLYSFDVFGMSALTIFMSLLTALVVIHFVRKFL